MTTVGLDQAGLDSYIDPDELTMGGPVAGVKATTPCTTPGSGNGTIQFKVSGTIALDSSLPVIFNSAGPSLTINGSSQNIIISGNNEVLPLFIFGVTSAITLNLQNLTIANGNFNGICRI